MAAQDIVNAYQSKLRRAPNARELESELENDSKYGHQRFLDELDRRAKPTFSGGGTGGDADLDSNGVADAGWMRNPETGAGRAWIRSNERPRALSDLLMPTHYGNDDRSYDVGASLPAYMTQPRQPMAGPMPGQWDGGYMPPGNIGPRIDRDPVLLGGGYGAGIKGPDGRPLFSTMPVQRRNTLASLLTYGA